MILNAQSGSHTKGSLFLTNRNLELVALTHCVSLFQNPLFVKGVVNFSQGLPEWTESHMDGRWPLGGESADVTAVS